MDYSGTQATKLYKYQWDYIHDPQTILFAWAEEEEEGEMQGDNDGVNYLISQFIGEIATKNLWGTDTKLDIDNFKKRHNILQPVLASSEYPHLTGRMSPPLPVISIIFNGFDLNNPANVIDTKAPKVSLVKKVSEYRIDYNLDFLKHKDNVIDKNGAYGARIKVIDYYDFIAVLKTANIDTKKYEDEIKQWFVNNINQASEIKDITTLVKHIPEDWLKNDVAYSKQLYCLQIASDNRLGDPEERAVIKLIRNIQAGNQKQLLADLLTNYTLNKLIYHIDGDEFDEFIFQLTDYILMHYPKPEAYQLESQTYFDAAGKIKNNHIYLWQKRAFQKDIKFHSQNSTSKNTFKITYDFDFSTDYDSYLCDLKPYEFVGVDLRSNIKFLGINKEEGFVIMPALLFHWLLNAQDKDAALKKIKLAVDGGLILFSFGEYAVAKTAVTRAFAIANLAVPTIDVIVNLSDLSHDEDYQDFIAVWNIIYNSYVGVTAARLAFHLLPEKVSGFIKFWSKNKANIKLKPGTTINEIDNTVAEIKRVYNVADDAVVKSFTTQIDNKVQIIAKNENLPSTIKKSFANNEYVTCVTKEKIVVYRDFGDKAFADGNFATTKQNATRSELALVEEFQNSMRFKATIEIPEGTTINLGKVSPWPPDKPKLPGGADQVLLPENYDHSWIKNITDTHTGKSYTLDEFKRLFPELFKIQ